MLPPLNLKVSIVFILLLGRTSVALAQAHNCSQDNDLSWVNELNRQANHLSQSSQKAFLEGAQTIVQNALESATDAKNCLSAEALVRLGEEGMRQTLRSPLLKSSLLKGRLLVGNGNSKELSGSRATETGVKDTHMDDAFPYPKFLVFISFSMPEETLKALNTQVNRIGGKLVLRGLVKGSFRETAQKLKELQIDIIIDPTLFEAYQIDRIPTFILRNAPTTSVEEDVTFDRLTGNVSLEYVLEQFSAHGNTQHEALEMLQTLRRKP